MYIVVRCWHSLLQGKKYFLSFSFDDFHPVDELRPIHEHRVVVVNSAKYPVSKILALNKHLEDPILEDTETLFNGLEEFRQHLGGRLTLTMLNAVGDPLDVHEVDRDLMRQAIERVAQCASVM